MLQVTYTDSLDWVNKLNRSPQLLGGYSPDSKSLLTYKEFTLIHEFTHALHFNQQQILGQEHPAWINEGIGTNFDAFEYNLDSVAVGTSNARLPHLKSKIESDEVIPWQSLFKMVQGEFMQDARTAYAQSGYIIRYLQHKGVLHDWYKEYVENYDSDPNGIESLKKYLGFDLEKTERERVEKVGNVSK